MSIESVVHWLIEHANVTAEEKTEQHEALSAALPPPDEEPTDNANG